MSLHPDPLSDLKYLSTFPTISHQLWSPFCTECCPCNLLYIESKYRQLIDVALYKLSFWQNSGQHQPYPASSIFYQVLLSLDRVQFSSLRSCQNVKISIIFKRTGISIKIFHIYL